MSDETGDPKSGPPLFGQFRSWTALGDVLRAFRILEHRTSPVDDPRDALSISIPRDGKIGPVAQMMVLWLARVYRCPEVLLRLAADIDKNVSAETVEKIRTENFDGEYTPIEFAESAFCTSVADFESMHLKSAPHMIELIQRPVMTLCGVIWRMTLEINPVRKYYEDEGASPQTWLQTNADSRLMAGIESCLRHAIGWPDGLCWSGNLVGGVVNGFRFKAFQGRPPFDKRIVDFAREANEDLCKRLAPHVQ